MKKRSKSSKKKRKSKTPKKKPTKIKKKKKITSKKRKKDSTGPLDLETIKLPMVGAPGAFASEDRGNVTNHFHHQVVRTSSHNVEENILKAMNQRKNEDQRHYAKLFEKIEGLNDRLENFENQYKQAPGPAPPGQAPTDLSGPNDKSNNQTSLQVLLNSQGQAVRKNSTDDYHGGVYSSEMNKIVLENGDNQNNFFGRGTIVGKESFPQLTQLVSDNMKIAEEPEEMEQTEDNQANEGASASNNAQKNNPHHLQPKNLFSNPLLRNDFENSFRKVRLYQGEGDGQKPPGESEEARPTKEEEEKLEQAIIKENLNVKIDRKKKTRNFSETYNKIYNDFNKTLDHIDAVNEDSVKRPSKRKYFFEENEEIKPLKRAKSAKELEEGRQRFNSKIEMKLEDLKKQTQYEERNMKNLKRFKSESNFDYKPPKDAPKAAKPPARKEKKPKTVRFKKIEIPKRKPKSTPQRLDKPMREYSDLLSKYIRPGPKNYRTRQLANKIVVEAEETDDLETRSYYQSSQLKHSLDQRARSAHEEGEYVARPTTPQRESKFGYLSSPNEERPGTNTLKKIVTPSLTVDRERVLENSQTRSKLSPSEAPFDNPKRYNRFVPNRRSLEKNKSAQESQSKRQLRFLKQSNSNLQWPANKRDSLFVPEMQRFSTKTESMLANQQKSYDDLENKLCVLFNKMFVYLSKIETLKMKINKCSGEENCYALFRRFCDTDSGEMGQAQMNMLLDSLDFPMDPMLLVKVFIYLNKYDAQAFDVHALLRRRKPRNLFKQSSKSIFVSVDGDPKNDILLRYEQFRELFTSLKMKIPEIYLFCNWSRAEVVEQGVISRSEYYLMRHILMLFGRMLVDVSRIVMSLRMYHSSEIFDFLKQFGDNS